jgi:transposase
MSSITITNEQWTKMVAFLRACPGVYVGQEATCRRFIEGLLWIARSGAQWRLLPKEYGHWNSIYKRFARWCDKGIWEQLHQHFADDPDMEAIILDSTIIRAHPCAAGALKKEGGQAEQALGRSRGGFSTKIHIGVDALGNPLRFILTAGQRHDITQAEALLADRKAPRHYDEHLYRERHLIECFVNKIKWYRRIFSRFEKLACRYLGFLSFVATLIWLR